MLNNLKEKHSNTFTAMSHKDHQLREEERRRRREEEARYRRSVNNVWMWIGVIILAVLLFFWIFDIGTYIGPNQ